MLEDHYEQVNIVRWHPTDLVLASGGADGNCMLWKLQGPNDLLHVLVSQAARDTSITRNHDDLNLKKDHQSGQDSFAAFRARKAAGGGAKNNHKSSTSVMQLKKVLNLKLKVSTFIILFFLSRKCALSGIVVKVKVLLSGS